MVVSMDTMRMQREKKLVQTQKVGSFTNVMHNGLQARLTDRTIVQNTVRKE